MAFTPFDFNEAIAQRREHAALGLRYGSPVVGVSCAEALMFLTVRRTQRKIFEIYDRLMYSAIGNQSDIEAVRLGAVDLAAREGYERSPDDVTAQRLVGFSLSPALKEVFRDQFRAPSVIRALFGELGSTPDRDVFFVLNYDGEFSAHHGAAVVAGTVEAEDAMLERISIWDTPPSLAEAAPAALRAWAAGVHALQLTPGEESEEAAGADDEVLRSVLDEELRRGHVEVGLLERNITREARFRLLGDKEAAELAGAT